MSLAFENSRGRTRSSSLEIWLERASDAKTGSEKRNNNGDLEPAPAPIGK
jgi:hypothetical protein